MMTRSGRIIDISRGPFGVLLELPCFFCFGAVEKNYAANPYLWADRELTGFEEGGGMTYARVRKVSRRLPLAVDARGYTQ